MKTTSPKIDPEFRDLLPKLTDEEYRIDGFWTMRLSGGEVPIRRQAGNNWELLIPVKFTDGKTRLSQDFDW